MAEAGEVPGVYGCIVHKVTYRLFWLFMKMVFTVTFHMSHLSDYTGSKQML